MLPPAVVFKLQTSAWRGGFLVSRFRRVDENDGLFRSMRACPSLTWQHCATKRGLDATPTDAESEATWTRSFRSSPATGAGSDHVLAQQNGRSAATRCGEALNVGRAASPVAGTGRTGIRIED